MNNDQQIKKTGDPADSSAVEPVSPDQIGVSSSMHKESEPVGSSEFIRPSTPEIELPEEVERTGVTVTPAHPRLTQVQRKAGIEPAKESVPIPGVPVVKLPAIDDERLMEMEKGYATDSGKYYSKLYKLILERIKLGLLRLGGQ
ncbi:MAG: hypothetical protein HYT11_03245 [Candidatus Levybacteria bacterium]|nr:hypothetical protein [Candidatus Levybacteria bacterium]